MLKFKKFIIGLFSCVVPFSISSVANASDSIDFSLKDNYISAKSDSFTQFSYLDDDGYMNVGLSLLKQPSSNKPYYQVFYNGLKSGSHYKINFSTLNISSLLDDEKVNFYVYGSNSYVYDGFSVPLGGWCSKSISKESSTQNFDVEFTAMSDEMNFLFVFPSDLKDNYSDRKDFGFGYKVKVEEVTDSVAPTLIINKDIDLEVNTLIRVDEKYLIDNRIVYATDNFDGVITSKIKIVDGIVDYFNVGRYCITLEVSDNSGNITRKKMYVNVNEEKEIFDNVDDKNNSILKFKDFSTNPIAVDKNKLSYDEIMYCIANKYDIKVSSLYGYAYIDSDEFIIKSDDIIDINDGICIGYYIDGENTLSSSVIKCDNVNSSSDKSHWYDWFINFLNKIVDFFKKLFGGGSLTSIESSGEN